MNYLSVELSCKLQSCALFPPYQGSMLRGLLGHNLRRAVCVTHKEDCLNCLLGRTCIFTKLFSLAPKLAPPFCLELPLKSLGNLSSGEIFSFGLILFGYAVEYLPFFVQAFIMGEESGLGQKTKDGFGRYKLISVKSNTAELYLAQKEQLKAFEASELKLPKLGNKEEEGELCLNLLTPLRFKQANHLGQRLEFSTLLQLILRRERALLALEGQDFAL
ncbi:MAG: hypothetical protein IJS50_02555, partial [Desulfovibrio sp.]|nr:hypothetical protein [Desulfovibrio sp.]